LLSINPAICWELRESRTTHRDVRSDVYDSDNVTGADNQQERLDGYISGYVDGEGSFSVAVQRNASCRIGYQLVPEFHVSQNGDRAQVLELIRQRLGCGYIKPNSARDRALVFVVRNRDDLLRRVIPFFERSPLLSAKHADFQKFAAVVRALALGRHRSDAGFHELLELALSMNGSGRHRRVRWREIVAVRNPQRLYAGQGLRGPEETVRAAWRHAESGRNDLALEPKTARE
jgi:LAGLIDADG endonuclease